MTTRVKRALRNSLSIFIAFLMALYVIPMSVFANDNVATDSKVADTTTPKVTKDTEAQEEEPYVLGEVESLRTETEKTFRLSNGNFAAVAYGQKVHYKNENDKWQDYDNTLAFESTEDVKSENEINEDEAKANNEKLDDSIKTGYKSANKDVNIKFADKNNGSSLFNIKNGKYSIGLNLIGSEKNIISVKNNTKKAPAKEGKPTINEAAALDKFSSSIIYEDILKNTDIQYNVLGDNIKENIIVKAKNDSYVYEFALDLKGVDPQLNEDGSISLLDETTKEIAFTIPAGYMFDAMGGSSNAVKYSLEQNNNKSYSLIVTADASWINNENRAFPVTIDPAIGKGYYGNSEADEADVRSNLPTNNTGYNEFMITGYSPYFECGNMRIYTKLNTLPPIPDTAVIVNASLNLIQRDDYKQYSGTTSSITLGARQVTSAWAENTLTWNNQPSVDSTILDFKTISASTESHYCPLDITSAAQKWYNGSSTNYGIAVYPLTEYTDNVNYAYASFFTSEFGAAGFATPPEPIFVITYRDNKGLESYWSYHSQSAGNAGTSYVNDFSGNLVLVNGDMTTQGVISPLSISHVYNSYCFNNQFDNCARINTIDNFGMMAGRGWKLNIWETIYPLQIGPTQYYVHSDSDGTEHYYTFDSEKVNWYNEDNPKLSLTIDSCYTIKDEYGAEKKFDLDGRISSIKDIYGNVQSFDYDNDKLYIISSKPNGATTYTDEITFSYNSNGALTRIKNAQDTGEYLSFLYSYPADGVISGDSCDYLRQVNYTKNNSTIIKCQYNYDGLGRLITAIDYQTSRYLSYSYSARGITSVTEHGSDGSSGQTINMSYSGNKTTTFWLSSKPDIKTNYVFDNLGRTICAYSTNTDTSSADYGRIYGASNSGYSTSSGDDKKVNAVTSESITAGTAYNYIKNSSFEGDDSWSFSSDPGYTASVVSYKPNIGNKSFETCSINSTTGTCYATQTVNLDTGYYTLSSYINATTHGNIYLEVWGPNGAIFRSDNIVDEAYASRYMVADWQRFSLTFNASVAGNYTILLVTRNTNGIVYFDNVMLEKLIVAQGSDNVMIEKGNAPSQYNLLEDSSFENSSDYWCLANGSYTSNKIQGLKGLYLNGIPSNQNFARQSVSVKLPSTQTFNLSGWAQAYSVNTHTDTSKKFELKAVVNYSNTETQTFTAPFNSDSNAWQYVSVGIVPTPSDSTATISSIDVYCSYDYNANYTYFDCISLTQEEAKKYDYNEKGNLTSINSIENLDGKNVYDTATGLDITETTLPTGEKLSFSYNPTFKHVVSNINSTNGTHSAYTYDSFGNLTSSTLSANNTSETISSSTSYASSTTDGPVYANKTTDSRGKETNYNYNSASGLLNYVKDANNHYISNSYDNLNRTTAVYEDTNCNMQADSGERKVQYTYANNMLQYIMTGTTNYNLNYDSYGNTACVMAGNNTLAQYTYEANNGKLTRTTYGNGFYIENEYDYLDRVVGIKYNGVEKFAFMYNANNRLSTSADYINNKIYSYDYDKYGRLVTAVEKTSSGTYVMGIYNRFDNLGRPVNSVYLFPENIMRYNVTYYENDVVATTQHNGKIHTLSLPDNIRWINYGYDPLQRLVSKNISGIVNNTYTYLPGDGANETTTFLSSLQLTPNSGSSTSYSYTYDDVGNILTISENGELKHVYTYDALNQLTSDTSVSTGSTITTEYQYDKAGNILYKREKSPYSGQILSTISYSYNNTNWKDLLTSYNGTTINYDSIGNPLNWHTYNSNINNLTWQGRQLSSSIFSGSIGVTYKYNSDGIRTHKYANLLGEVDYSYVLDGSKIIRETRNGSGVLSATIYYYYDESGVTGFNYNGTCYYYGKNAQGDITKIYDASGVEVVSYTYDTWGKILSTTGTLASTIGQYNPFRYRGYYYDSETGWYYCNSRYYDPNVGRFINADGIVGANGGLQGYNMFAYCNNNPVNNSDPSGYFYGHSGINLNPGYALTMGGATPEDIIRLSEAGLTTCNTPFKPESPTKSSDQLHDFIGDYEGGFRSEPYDDGYGNPTIGYGHKIQPGEKFTIITEEKAREILSNDLKDAEIRVTNYSEKKRIIWDQQQYDALVSVSFNAGYGVNKIIDKISAGVDTVSAFTWAYTLDKAKAGKDVGLWRRRMDEAEIFMYGEYIRYSNRMP